MRFEPRACPLCRSTTWTPLLHVTPRTLFAQNWSYRPEALALLADIADEPQAIGQCTRCAFVFAPLLPSDDVLEIVYERAIDAGKARAQNLSPSNAGAKMRWASTLLGLAARDKQRVRVLDYGCGFGPTLEVLASLTNVDAVGFETSPARLADLAARGLNATGDRDTAAAAGPFDAVILDNVLEHLADPSEAAVFVRSVCDDGAAVFVGVPQRTAAQLRALEGRHDIPMDVNPWEHLNYFSAEHLDALMGRAGFRPLQASEIDLPIDVGLRPESSAVARAKNAAASALRAAGYVATGDLKAKVEARFYLAA